jgi:hypothetical protein
MYLSLSLNAFLYLICSIDIIFLGEDEDEYFLSIRDFLSPSNRGAYSPPKLELLYPRYNVYHFLGSQTCFIRKYPPVASQERVHAWE